METKKIKIEIKNRFTGKVLFEYEKENNTVKETLVEAVKSGANLGGANLSGANLGGANLYGADLSGANLGGADLRGAELGGADLYGADLRGAELGGADLYGADLYGANLYGADLSGAELGGADLYGADLRGAELGGADLYGADLYGANLYGANLRGANLRGANLGGAKDIPFIPMACPSDGSFIGWKKVYDVEYEEYYLVKLGICEDSKRSSSIGTKCRCDKAKVLEITEIATGKNADLIVNTNYVETTYKVGEMVYADSFDENRWEECSHGIHFFINRQEAVDYDV